jgi:hypothetical protein
MYKNATKCNKTQSKWCINKHGASKIIDTFEMYQAHVDPNNVPLASLVAQKEHVDVNFIRNNNFNNSAYRNNFASNNYRSYPSTNGNGYGNSYGNSSNNTRGCPLILKSCSKTSLVNKLLLISLLRKRWVK